MWPCNEYRSPNSLISQAWVLVWKDEILKSDLIVFLLSLANRLNSASIHSPKEDFEFTSLIGNVRIDKKILDILFSYEFLAGRVKPVKQGRGSEFWFFSKHFFYNFKLPLELCCSHDELNELFFGVMRC